MSSEEIIKLLQEHGLLCTSEEEVCHLSASGSNCDCGNIMNKIRNQ